MTVCLRLKKGHCVQDERRGSPATTDMLLSDNSYFLPLLMPLRGWRQALGSSLSCLRAKQPQLRHVWLLCQQEGKRCSTLHGFRGLPSRRDVSCHLPSQPIAHRESCSCTYLPGVRAVPSSPGPSRGTTTRMAHGTSTVAKH